MAKHIWQKSVQHTVVMDEYWEVLMYLNKAPVRNNSIDRKFRRRVHMTQHMSKIDRRRQKLSQHESLYGRLYYKTRDTGYLRADISLNWAMPAAIGGYGLCFAFLIWFGTAADAGELLILPLCLMALSAVATTWLLSIKWSYKAYYIVMGKHYDRKIEKISAKQAKVLPNTFVTAVVDALGRDETDTMPLLSRYPGRINELFEAYKGKVAAVDSTKNDNDVYRKARCILVGIFREDLKDILEEERIEKEAERKTDELQDAKERQRRRAEAEQNQKTLSDLSLFYDTYKQLGE